MKIGIVSRTDRQDALELVTHVVDYLIENKVELEIDKTIIEKLPEYESYDYNSVNCPVAEKLQRQIIQLKTNYFDEEEIKNQAEVLKRTLEYFEG